jgi:formylmethanofuran dehydrogenase subunit E
MPDSVLFRVQQVRVEIKDCDLPGPTRYKVSCSSCGQAVRDQREVIEEGKALCRPCAQKSYFSDAREVTWPDMNWNPESGLTHSSQGTEIIETNCY